MRRRHFEALEPICPVCRLNAQRESPLVLGSVEAVGESDDILEGILHCSHVACRREYPILNGVPILVANLRQFVTEQGTLLRERRDRSLVMDSLLGDCEGPDSPLQRVRQQISSYAWDHWGDCVSGLVPAEVSPGSCRRLLEHWQALAEPQPNAPILEVGCATGRTAFELAARSEQLVLGIDLHWGLLRVAAELLRTGRSFYDCRQVGLVYERHAVTWKGARPDNLDFWACDALCLPFRDACLGQGLALNVLDSVSSPWTLLQELARVIRPTGQLGLSCPYDWSPQATALEQWIGGHSQRSPEGGDSSAVLQRLLTADSEDGGPGPWRIEAQRDHLPWHVRVHARSVMTYSTQLWLLRRRGIESKDQYVSDLA